jgi:tRNA A-37 threonylcarbamoyl transferase component Bud32
VFGSSLADHPQSGQRFGNYLVRECVGRGGMARVYRAQHAELGKVVALKVMDRDRLEDPQWGQRFLREAKSAAALGHPNIVDVTDVGVEGDVPFLVMEFLEGNDLAAYLADEGQLSEQAMADLLLPIIAGLGFAHDCGIVHRDIKPSNIFLARLQDGSLVPKLLDFGIAKSSFPGERTDALETDTHQVIGTPMFMAPEALDGARHLTDRSDQYSLALVMYQCLTGRAPFESQSQASLFRAIASGAYRPLRETRSDLSKTAKRLLERALALEPDRRFSHVREMGALLYTLASPRSQVLWASTFGGESSAGQRLFAGRAPRAARSRLPLALGAGASFVVLTAVFALLLRSSAPPPPEPLASALPQASAALGPAPASIGELALARAANPPPPAEPAPVLEDPRPPHDERSGPGASRSEQRVTRASTPIRRAPRTEAGEARDATRPERSAQPNEQDELRELFPTIGGDRRLGVPGELRRDGAAIPE